MTELENFLRPTQEKLFRKLRKMYPANSIAKKDEFLLVKGEAPIMLVAHLDTVHQEPVKVICRNTSGNILMSPQGVGGDDRCGVYALVNAYEASITKPCLLFTCDEEVGGVGANAFVDEYSRGNLPLELTKLKMIVEIDRKGSTDAVYYGCANSDFEDYITSKGFQTANGTFSDISIIAPVLGVAAVNLSSGYYDAHTLHEYINRKHIDAVIGKIIEIVADVTKANFPKYEYVESKQRLLLRRYGQTFWGNRYDNRNLLPQNLPSKYAEAYDVLLEYYPQEEIESYRKAYGDTILKELCDALFCAY